MKRKRYCAALSVLVCCLFTSASLAQSESRWIFVGHYEASVLAEGAETAQLTLAIRIFNKNDADALAATITLEGSRPLADEAILAWSADIRAQASTCLSRTFNLLRDEHDRWQKGHAPPLRLDFRDAAGRAVRTPIAMFPMSVEEEGQPCVG